MPMPDKFPEGTEFFYVDFFPTARYPDGKFMAFDPEPYEVPAAEAIPTPPAQINEAEFREKVAAYNAA
jgi:hypothetical protein